MQVGESVTFELFQGRYVDGVVRSVWHERGLVKLHVEYGPGSFATILSDEIVPISKRTETKVSNREMDSDTYF